LNSKLHLVCDGAGRPVCITVSAGNEADISHAKQCLEPVVRNGAIVIADRGYDADHLREWLRECKAKAGIPPRKNRKKKARYSSCARQNPQFRRALFQSYQRLAFVVPANLPVPGNLPGRSPSCCNRHLVLMSLRPRRLERFWNCHGIVRPFESIFCHKGDRHEWLDQNIFETIEEAQEQAINWLWTYNND